MLQKNALCAGFINLCPKVFAKFQGFPSGGSCRRSRLMRGGVVGFELSPRLRHPTPPLCKGRWHGEAVTKGLCGTMPQIGTRQCESVQSTTIAVGEGFYPARAGCTRKITRAIGKTVKHFVGADASVRPAVCTRKPGRTNANPYNVCRGRCPHRPAR